MYVPSKEMVSIIIQVYNVAKYLDDCIQSLIRQSYDNLQIILVDDGSIDNSLEICKKWEKIDNRVKVFHQEKKGLCAARNTGISYAEGEYLCFVDSDDCLHWQFIEIMFEVARENYLDMVACRYLRFHERNELKEEFINEVPQYLVKGIKNLFAKHEIYCWGALYKRSIIEQKKLLFDENLSNLEDAVWNCIYMQDLRETIYIDLPLYFYRMRPNQITGKIADGGTIQIKSWCYAAKSVLKWCSETKNYNKKQLKEVYRFLLNNYYYEAYVKKLSYKECRELPFFCCDKTLHRDLFPAWFLHEKMMIIEYHMYYLLFNIREYMKKMMQRNTKTN